MIREQLDRQANMPATAKDSIDLDHLPVATMTKVLEFMYTSKITFDGSELREYLEVSMDLELDSLTERCLKLVTSRLTHQNVLV